MDAEKRQDIFFIEATDRSPEVKFDFSMNELRLVGESYPENVAEFYQPVFSTLQQYLEACSGMEISFHFELLYFNSSSAKVIMELFDLMDSSAENGNQVLITWALDEEDDGMRDKGEIFSEDLQHAKFQMQTTSFPDRGTDQP